MAWICLCFTMLPAGIMYALNFERLGQPEKKNRTLILVLSAAVIYYLFVIRFLLADEYSHSMNLALGSRFHLINIVIAWGFYLGQQRLFARYMRQGGRRAPVFAPIVLAALWMLILAGGSALYIIAGDDREFDRAAALLDAGKYPEAEAIFKSYKADYPDETGVYLNLAIIYARTERVDLAKQELKYLLEREPDNKEAKEFLQDLQAP